MNTDINSIKNIHPNKDFIILGTGNSINSFSFDFCEDKISIGCNGIGLLYDPNYYAIFDPFAFNTFKDVFIKSNSKKILATWIDFEECDYKLDYLDSDVVGLSKNKIYSGRTVGYIAMNIAYIMGARRIYLIGIDGYKQNEKNHFLSHGVEYENRSITTWNNERENIVLNAFIEADKELKINNVELINLSLHSFLKNSIRTEKI